MDLEPTGRKVLIVEDEPSIRKVLHALVAGLGCDGEIVDSGRQALASLNRDQFDAVLLDLRCSDLVAEEVVPQIQKMRPSLVGRVLVITAEVADAPTLDLIRRHCVVQLHDNNLLEKLRGLLPLFLATKASPDHASY